MRVQDATVTPAAASLGQPDDVEAPPALAPVNRLGRGGRLGRAARAVAGCLLIALAASMSVGASALGGSLVVIRARPPSTPAQVASCRASRRRTTAARSCDAAQVHAARVRRAVQARLSGAPSSALRAARQGFRELFGFGDSNDPMAWNPNTGLWIDQPPTGLAGQPAWWQSGIAAWATVRYLEATGSASPAYQQALDSVFTLNVQKPGSAAPVNFGNQYMDDTGWWGLTWAAAARYELGVRGDRSRAWQYLAVAEWDASYIEAAPRVCAGIVWRLHRPPDTISTAEFVALTAQLYRLRSAPGPFHDPAKAAVWLADARSRLRWLQASGLVNMSQGSVYDTLNGDCRPTGRAMTYSEGEVADALVQMGAALHNPSSFAQARTFIDYTLRPGSPMTAQGVLREYCEAQPGRCAGPVEFNVASFKGVFAQALADYDLATGTRTYQGWLQAQARAILARDTFSDAGRRASCRTPDDCQFGFYWDEAVSPASAPVRVSVATQTSALQALTSALATGAGGGSSPPGARRPGHASGR